jgi:hypothetical protein
MNKFKSLLPGALIGVLLVLAVQYGMESYKNKQTISEGAVFMEGYDKAADKIAFTEEFAKNTDGVSVSVSTSSADEGCGRWWNYYLYYLDRASAWADLPFNDPRFNKYLVAYQQAGEQMLDQFYACVDGSSSVDI